MISGDSGTYLGLLSFLSFGFSVIAAVLAIDMYTLLRTGELGKTWRILIIASVMFALAQVVRMAETLSPYIAGYGLSQVIELVFMLTLAYAFYVQRRAFNRVGALREKERHNHGRRHDDHPATAFLNPAPEADSSTRTSTQNGAPQERRADDLQKTAAASDNAAEDTALSTTLDDATSHDASSHDVTEDDTKLESLTGDDADIEWSPATGANATGANATGANATGAKKPALRF